MRVSSGTRILPGRFSRIHPAIATLALIILLLAPLRTAQAEDFLGEDKYFHAVGSMALAQTGFGVTLFLQERDSTGIPWAVGAASALVPGLIKEGIDAATRNNHFSWQDLAWDGIGTVVGLTIAQLLWLAFQK